MKCIFVGEANPYGGHPCFALYPLPEGSAGHRLCRNILQVSRVDYLRNYERVNLCAENWRMREAKLTAVRLLLREEKLKLVLLGRKVCDAFDVAFHPFEIVSVAGKALIILPHPSGLNRIWNEPGSVERARALLKQEGII